MQDSYQVSSQQVLHKLPDVQSTSTSSQLPDISERTPYASEAKAVTDDKTVTDEVCSAVGNTDVITNIYYSRRG